MCVYKNYLIIQESAADRKPFLHLFKKMESSFSIDLHDPEASPEYRLQPLSDTGKTTIFKNYKRSRALCLFKSLKKRFLFFYYISYNEYYTDFATE